MPFGGHIADVAREGIWASLTGGWYYEPSHSMFCNTLHLYVWALLLLLPLLFGISINNGRNDEFNTTFAIIYLLVLGFLFVLIKLTVLLLHRIFDTFQPIKYKSRKAENAPQEESQRCVHGGRFSASSFSATRATESNAMDMIEMLEMNQERSRPLPLNSSGGEPNVVNVADSDILVHNATDAVEEAEEKIESEAASTNRSTNGKALIEENVSNASAHGSSSSTSSKGSANGLLNFTTSKKCFHRSRGSGRGFLDTADSLELIPGTSRMVGSQQLCYSERKQKLECSQQQKFNELGTKDKSSHTDSISSLGRRAVGHTVRHGRRKSEEKMNERPFIIRRVNSTMETRDIAGKKKPTTERAIRRAALLIPNNKTGNLGAHFPGGIFVDELELNKLGFRMERKHHLLAQKEHEGFTPKSTALSITDSERKEAVHYRQKMEAKQIEQKNITIEEQEQPCCSSKIGPSWSEDDPNPKDNNEKDVQLNPLMENSTELIMHGTSEMTTASGSADLKGQITKFLEELIAKHPEAIDAIESVRMNRLIQLEERRQRNSQNNRNMLCRPHHSTRPNELILESEGKHLALDTMDSTAGAVHAFQDEHGNWFTYCFGPQSSGTAQPLMSASAQTEAYDHGSSDEQHKKHRKNNETESIYLHHRPLVRTLAQTISQDESTKLEDAEALSLTMKEKGQTHCAQPTVVNVIEKTHRDTERAQKCNKRSTLSSSSSSSSSTLYSKVDPLKNKQAPANSSSSDEADNYIIPTPINVIRACEVQTEARGSGTMSLCQNRSGRPHSRTTSNRHGRHLSDSRHLLTFMQRLCQGTAGEPEFAARMAVGVAHSRVRTVLARPMGTSASATTGIGSLERVDQQQHPASSSVHSPSVNTVRLLNDLQLGRPIPSGLLLYQSAREAYINRPCLKYCYRIKIPSWLDWWPFGGNKEAGTNSNGSGTNIQREFKLKLDRLALAALFDRNSSLTSCVFDIVLAFTVSLLVILVLSRHIYSEMSLLLFAFVVAGAQFSLLKSVQPDSASPIHGFNWQVTYSRPAYFILLSSIILILDWVSPNEQWFWRPSWLRFYANRPFSLSSRDLVSNALLFLPIAFTLGLLPQVNTMCMHLFEQIDMHIFGATASLSLGSACFSIIRSVLSVMLLTSAIKVVKQFPQNEIENSIGFSAFVALVITLSYLLSRSSSNPYFVKLLWNAIWRRLKSSKTVDHLEDTNEDHHYASQSTLSTAAPHPKQLLGCCLSTASSATTSAPNAVERKHKMKKRHTTENGMSQTTKQKLVREEAEEELLSGSPIHTIILRIQHDIFSTVLRALILFGLHCTLVFQAWQPRLEAVLTILCFIIGLLNHHVYPQMRAKNPWKFFAQPILRPFEFGQFESTVEAKLTSFEIIHAWMLSLEKNILYPLLLISLMSTSGKIWNVNNFWTLLLLTTCTFRLSRTGYSQPNMLHFPLLITFLLQWHFDLAEDDTSLFSNKLICFFLLTVFWSKLIEFLLKVHFILCYIAPWQISWGSAFHAFAQPFSVPHSGLTLAQTLISSIISAPLNPFLGSSFFLMSYVRPVKFWERDYNTKRIDHSELRLASQLDRGPMIDDSNLNSIFYEHLTRSLQKSLAGDLLLGRWACTVRSGDCFILASSYLNCMIQLIEIGNGFVTFQLRGLEFRGTYCHQREMEAISEDWVENNGGCFCCSIGRLRSFISFNNAWTLRWLAWEVTAAKYVVDGYSISDNSAVNMLQVHELRRLLVTLYVKCMIFYAIESKLASWLSDESILKALEPIRQNARFVDPDPVFSAANDEDYDLNMGGLSRQSFNFLYSGWIEYCLSNRSQSLPLATEKVGTSTAMSANNQLITSFCFALSILGRRALGTAAYNRHANAAESFLFGMHALFKGDLRIMHPADEWVFADLEILNRVIAPAVRMALKLHQDHFAAVVDLDEPSELHERINHYKEKIFISHEHDPEWRRAILANTRSLLALRHICDDGQDDYKVIMLNKRHLDMRVIKLNKECVRAFWAGQQQELIFLRNKNPERGSIQNARQVLRNMINSSADQPIGYPIYVSPLTTSFVETHNQLRHVLGPPLTLHWCLKSLRSLLGHLRAHFGPSASSSVHHQQQHSQSIPMSTLSSASSAPPPPIPAHQSEMLATVLTARKMEEFGDDDYGHAAARRKETLETKDISCNKSSEPSGSESSTNKRASVKLDDWMENQLTIPRQRRRQHSLSNSLFAADYDHHKPSREEARRSSAFDVPYAQTRTRGVDELVEKATQDEIVEIENPGKIFASLNAPLRSTGDYLVYWPEQYWRLRGGASGWPSDWRKQFGKGTRGVIVHQWNPFNASRAFRSHAGHIYLLKVEVPTTMQTYFVPILAEGICSRINDDEE